MDVKSDLGHDDAQKNFNPIGVNGLHMADTSIWAQRSLTRKCLHPPQFLLGAESAHGITSNT
jgi:hypothetical protein